MAKSSTAWSKLSNAPFSCERLARSPFMIEDDIIISVQNDPFIHRFKTKSGTWMKSSFGDYTDIEWHSICLSNDKKYIYLFEGRNKMILIQFDINTMKTIKTMKHCIRTGIHPAIIADPEHDELIHIVGGSLSKTHFTLNTKNGKTQIIHTFDDVSAICGAGIVFIKKKNMFLYFHGGIPVHSFNLNTKIWKNMKIKMPQNKKPESFGYILARNGQFVVLFGGCTCDGFNCVNDIMIFDVRNKIFKTFNVKAPENGSIETVLTQNGDIHLFSYDYHYRLNINTIVNVNLVNGYIHQYQDKVILSQRFPDAIIDIVLLYFGDIN